MIHDPWEGQSILPSKLQLLLTHMQAARAAHREQYMVWEGRGTSIQGWWGTALVPGSGKEALPIYSVWPV